MFNVRFLLVVNLPTRFSYNIILFILIGLIISQCCGLILRRLMRKTKYRMRVC